VGNPSGPSTGSGRDAREAAIHVGDVPAGTFLPDWYAELLDSVSAHVAHGHRRAVRAANTELLRTYWSIGREILDRQQRQGWGAKVLDRLLADLKDRFPGARGDSPRNLKYMRSFAAAWPGSEIVQGSLAQLPWYHHVALLDKLDDRPSREWYAAQAVENGWSRDILALQIESQLHERAGKAITNFASTLPPHDSDLAQQATRDPYLFDFLGTAETHRERDLE
jgi:predicted nuclease of restriction endonuclease-like (RecB) superfamily